MAEMRDLTQDQALALLLDAVEALLCSCLYQENRAGWSVDPDAITLLEDAYDLLMSFQVDDTTQETADGAL